MLRRVLFWVHLIAGVVAGAIIGIMCFTGVLLAFEHEIVSWAERDARVVDVPPDAERLALDGLIANARAANPDATPTGITIAADPTTAVAVAFGRDLTYYVNPYTGEARQPASTAVHDFMHVMVEWHRWLAMSGDQRATGKAITGACNAAFLVLGITGLYLWWPRQWTRRALRPSLWFVGARGKARDWNWHNVIGIWTLPVLIVLTASGMVISYRWAGNLVYRAFGEEPPQQPGPGAAPSTPVAVPTPPPNAAPLSLGSAFAAAQTAVPGWETISLRIGNPRGAGGSAATSPRAAGAAPANGASAARPSRAEGTPTRNGGERANAQPITLTIRETDRFPTFGSTTLVLDPYTGTPLNQTGFHDLSPGRQARMWMRYLHVGQGFGWFGQLIALFACVGGLVLVYTGFALAFRRFFRRSRAMTVAAETATPVAVPATSAVSRSSLAP